MHNIYDDPAYSAQRERLMTLLRQVQQEYGDTDPDERERVLFRGDRRIIGRTK